MLLDFSSLTETLSAAGMWPKQMKRLGAFLRSVILEPAGAKKPIEMRCLLLELAQSNGDSSAVHGAASVIRSNKREIRARSLYNENGG